MHPVVFVGGSVLLGVLFALQEWMNMQLWNEPISVPLLLEAWAVQYFLCGVLCWLLWWWMGSRMQNADLPFILTRVLPLSIVASVVEEMIWVVVFPNLPLHHAHMNFWPRLAFHLKAEIIDNLVIFWCAFGLFRGIGYYRQFREKEDSAAQLEMQLAHAQIRALRMQLNPHFLFNTMNSISSLMPTDIVAADKMLEQLSSLLRITLERGEVQLIPLSDEMAFTETYLAMQDCRFTGRVRQEVFIEPELHDALVPAMLLQPVIENAYTHGLSKLNKDGLIAVAVRCRNRTLTITVVNSGVGLDPGCMNGGNGHGVGLANVKDRMRLHYGSNQDFTIEELEQGKVQVTLTLPLQFSERQTEALTGYGV